MIHVAGQRDLRSPKNMRIKLNNLGELYISRRGAFEKQICPFTVNTVNGYFEYFYCGEWCPLFSISELNDGKGTLLELCQASYIIKNDNVIVENKQ